MQAQIVADWDYLEFRLNAAFAGASVSGSQESGGFCNLNTYYSPNYYSVNDGIRLSMKSHKGTSGPLGASSIVYTLVIPDLSISATVTVAGFASSGDCQLIFEDVKLYSVNGALWYLKWSALKWYIGGVLQTDYGPDNILSGAYFTPTSIPLIGHPAKIAAAGLVNPVPSIGLTHTGMTPYSNSGSCDVTGSGWRYKIGSTWLTPPVNCSVLAVPTLSCGVTPTLATVSASTTYDGACSGSAVVSGGTSTISYSFNAGDVTLMPTMDRSVGRMNDDYAAFIFRWGLPYAKRFSEKICELWEDDDPTTTSAETYDEFFPSYSYLDGVVTNTPHVIEDPMADTLYAPYSTGGQAYYMTTSYYYHGVVASQMQDFVESHTSQMCPAFKHDSPVFHYMNTCANPHWHYVYYWPADSDTEYWKLDGVKVNSEDYWAPIRTQYLEHSSLPTGDRLKTRNSIVAAPMMEGAFSAWLKTYVFANSQTSWWGNCRWKAKQWNPVASIALDADTEDDWTATDCVLTFGATKITVNVDTGKTTGILEYDLGQFVREPFLYGHIANLVSLNWVSTNVSAVRLYLVSANGEKELMGSTIATHQKAFITGTKYAGSWAQDFGYGATTDFGADTEASGVSSAAMIDPELWLTIGQVGARNGANIRIEVDVVSAAVNAEVYYPVLYRPTTNAKVWHEHGHCSAMLWDSGPGLRYGQWAWLETDPVTNLLSVPVIYPIGTAPLGWKSSMFDAYCWKNSVLEGVDRSTNLATQIQADFDNYELIGVDTDPSNDNQIYRECDSLSISFVTSGGDDEASLIGGTYHLVNGCDCPPVQWVPYAIRDDLTFQIDLTGFDMKTYALDQQPRYTINAAVDADIVEPDPSTDVWTASISGEPTDWNITSHQHQVLNNETDSFRIRSDGNYYATCSPYHGYTMLLFPVVEGAGHPIAYAVSRDSRHARGYVLSGTLWLGWSQNSSFSWTAVDTGITDVTSLSLDFVRASQFNTLRVCICEAGAVKVYNAAAEDGVLTLAITVGTGQHGAVVERPDGVLYTFRLDTGTVYMRAYDADGNALFAEQTTSLTGLDDAEIDARYSVGPNQNSRIGMVHLVGGTVIFKTSSDGITFS